MLILSTFNSDYLQSPLQSLLKLFKPQPVNIKYVNKNLIVELLNLKSNLEEKNSYVILFRINDFKEISDINLNKLEDHLDLIVKQITVLKQEKGFPILVFLCPILSEIYNNNPILEALEKKIIKSLNENKIHTLTLSNIKERYGDIEFENPVEGDTHIPYVPKFYAAIAALLARKLHAIIQKPYKVIAVDCDHTLWDGAAADLGAEAVLFKEHNIFLQNYLVEQQKKGIIICLCSKNEQQTVLDVFNQRQTEMPLKLHHINKYKINWKEKAENIKELALDLNVFPDSFLFIDDNPIEINNVSQIPGITCITMPQNLQECKDECLFDIDEHAVITETDKKRFELYKQAEIKAALATEFRDPIQFLRSTELGQSIVIRKIEDEENEAIERVSQLSGRTNQFNTFPEVEAKSIYEINEMVRCDKKEVFVGIIKDRDSEDNYEDISAISMCRIERNTIKINNFFVSCRSFNRGIEFEMLKHIAQTAQEKNIKNIEIKFKKSDKNKAASLFLNILIEKTNKDQMPNVDFNKLKKEEEFTLNLSVQKIMELELDDLVRASLNAPQNSTQEHQNKEITLPSNQEINKKYLIELKQITNSLDYLENKFFINDELIKLIPELEDKINRMCIHLLGEKGQDCSLVERGLDSLKAAQLRYYLYENYGVDITIPQFLCQKMTVFSLIEDVKRQRKTTELVAQNDDFYNQTLPVSFQQQRIGLAEQKEPARNSANYHMTTCYKVSKNLDVPRFKLACQKIIMLYDAFGSSFFMQDGVLTLSVLAPEDRKLNFQEVKLKPEESLEKAIELEISKPWTMTSEAPLIHFILFEDSANYHIFFHVHHAIFDAISLKNCLDSLSELYRKLDSELSPPQYVKLIQYQKQKYQNKAYQAAASNFFRSEFSEVKTVSISPADKFALSLILPVTRYSFLLSVQEVLNLEHLAKSLGVTFYSLLCACYILLIASYTFQENITLVTVTNGRDGDASFNKMVGFFVNLLVHRFEFKKNQLFTDLVKQVNKKLLDSQKFQDIPFNKIQEVLADLGIKDILLSPAFIFQNYPIPELKLNDEKAELELPKQPIIFDKRKITLFGGLTLYAQRDDKGGLNLVFECKDSEYSEARLNDLDKHFKILINECCEDPNRILQEIPLTSKNERNELMRRGRGPDLNYAQNDNLVKRFELNFKKYPKRIALCYDKTHLTYEEVNKRSTNLAHALNRAGAKQGNYVGILLDANHLFFIAELAVLKIGAIFIPLSKEDPCKRLKSIIEDANIKFFIVDSNEKNFFVKDSQKYQLISIDSIKSEGSVDDFPPPAQTMEDKACILYTSGSTGTPKGVVLLQKGIFRVVESPNFVTISPEDKIAQTANQAFDAAQLECWLAWNNGACLVLFDKKTILDINLLGPKLISDKITHMWLTAGLFNIHANNQPDLFKRLNYLIVGGDVVHKDSVSKVLSCEGAPTVVNGFGPSEATIFTLTHTFDTHNLDKFVSSPIGRPINNTVVEILTPWKSLAPLGAIGELVIGGDGVAKGYLNLPELEDERFISDLELKKYVSGDLVQYHPGSEEIIFVGRANEQQIKINGNLVSIEEVRCACLGHPAINQVEVIIKELKGNNILVAFYTLNEATLEPTAQELREFLSKKLPPYMTPNHFVSVNSFLTNANGKLDKEQFKGFQLQKTDSHSSKKILGEHKEILALVKEQLIGFPDNIEANFFNWGLNSLQAVSLMSKLNKKFFTNEYKLTVADLQTNPTTESLTSLIKKPCVEKEKTILRLLKKGDQNLPAIIFIHPAGGGISCFNPLIAKLQFNNACYGIEDPLLHSNQLELLTLEKMAENYFDEIRNKFKTPIVLAGFSFGGLLAWEIAQLFETKAENNNLVKLVLFDTWVVSCASEATKDRLMQDVIEYCAKQREKGNVDENLSDMLASLKTLCEHHQAIGFKFTPNRLEKTPVYLYKATQLDEHFSEMKKQDENNYLLRFIDPKLLETSEIDASHYTLLENPDKNLLANKFSKNIEEITRKIISKKDNNPVNNAYSTLFSQPTTRQGDYSEKKCNVEKCVKSAR